MPKSMFQDVVCPHADSTRKWYTLPLSFIIHTSILIVLVVIPLMAGDVLPSPRLMTTFVTPVAPPTPPPAMVVRHVSVTPVTMGDPSLAPIEAPQGIAPDNGIVPEREQAIGVPGMIEGFGNTVSFEAPPPPPPPAVVKPVRPGGAITAPTRIKDVAPVYPAIAQSARVQGDVIIEATIGTDGRVQDARVLRSAPLLDQAAVAAVLAWQYTPTLLNGQPVPIIMTVTVRFRLQ
jgi:protein TonB